MALGGLCQFEVKPTGNDLNAGGFNAAGTSPGTDRSQQDAPHVIIDGATITATVHTTTTQIILAGYTVTSADNRNLVRISGGTATAGLYEIVAFDTVNNRWTLDRAVGTAAATATGRMGGALASLGMAAGSMGAQGHKSWVKSSTYVTTVNTANVSGGIVSLSAGGSIEAYDTVRGDKAAKTIVRPHANSMTMFSWGGTGVSILANIRVEADGFTGITAFSSGSSGRGSIIDCEAINCATGFTAVSATRSYAQGCTTGFTGGSMAFCVAKACATGFASGSSLGCIAVGCTSTGFATSNGAQGIIFHCVAHACATGYSVNTIIARFINCIASSNTVKGFASSVGTSLKLASHNNTNDLTPDYVLVADPFVNSSATINNVADAFAAFTLNDVANGGALLKGVGLMGYSDIGAFQHQDTGGSGTGGAASFIGSSFIAGGLL